MPFKQDVQGPNQEEIFDTRKYIVELLGKQKPEYGFRNLGQGLVGGLFNAIGGIFGNSDLGGELFGRKEQDMSPMLLEALLKQSAMKEDIALRREELQTEKALRKETMDLQKELTRMQITAENDRQKTEVDLRKTELKERFKHDESMQSLDTKSKSELAELQAKLELGRISMISNAELENALRLADQANGHAVRQVLMTHGLKVKEVAQAHGYNMQALDAQLKAAATEGTANRTTQEKLTGMEIDSRKAEAQDRFKHEEKMQALDTKAKASLVTLQSKLESDKVKEISNMEFENALKLAEQANGHEARKIFLTHGLKLREFAAEHGYDMQKLNAQISAAKVEGEAERKTKENIADKEASSRVEATKVDAQSRVEATKIDAAGRTEAAKIETDNRMKVAEAEATKEATEQSTKTAKATLDIRGRLVAALDSMTTLSDELGDYGTQYLNGPGIGLRELVTSDTRTAIMGKDVSFSEDTIEQMKNYLSNRAAILADTHSGDKERTMEALMQEITTGSQMLKDTSFKARASQIPGGDPTIDSETYGILDAAMSKQRATFESLVPEVIDDIMTKFDWHQNTHRAISLLSSGNSAIKINSPQLKTLINNKPSMLDTQDKWQKWMADLQTGIQNESQFINTGDYMDRSSGPAKRDALTRAIELLR